MELLELRLAGDESNGHEKNFAEYHYPLSIQQYKNNSQKQKRKKGKQRNKKIVSLNKREKNAEGFLQLLGNEMRCREM
jgi:hypothetical protein